MNAKTGKYTLSTLTTRPGNAVLPKVHIVDMRTELDKQGFTHFSSLLLEKIKDRYEKGEQTLLFLNKREIYPLSFLFRLLPRHKMSPLRS